MDFPMLYAGNPVPLVQNQVFFLHMVLMDSESGSAFSLGRTYIVSRDKPEPLSKFPLGMILR
jgi:Xaa-Pro dipeptidase